MDDDDRILDALGRALVPPAHPPPGRLHGFLAGVDRPRPQARPTPPKLGWLAAGASVVAAVAVLLVLALPSVLSPGEGASTEAASSTRDAVTRLRTALAGGDPIAVAEADADLLRIAGGLPDREAVSAHTRAVAFLRDNPAPVEFVPGPDDGRTSVAAPAPQPRPAPAPGSPPAPGASSTTAPTAAVRVGPSVDIVAVTAELDGSFRVDFATRGFTPDPSRAPGTYAVRFSFDGGDKPAIWTGSSPWVFPLGDGLLYRQVCAEVVDHTAAAVPSTRNCRPIG